MDAKRLIALVAISIFALSACRAIPGELFADEPEVTPEPTPTPITKSFCESGADLRTDIEFLRAAELSEDGLLPFIVAIDAALGEARTLTTLAGLEYGPLVADVIISLQDLRDIAEEVEAQETLGAGIATIGEAITEVGQSMDTLTTQLREPCPESESDQ
jgi:hypothetical protein